MNFTFYHNNINVYDLEKSLDFYEKALGLTVTRETEAEDGSFKLVYLGDGATPHLLELTWLRDMDRPYDLGDNEFHLAFHTDDFEKAHQLHKEMGCICFENEAMGIYFISDPDGYWLEICPQPPASDRRSCKNPDCPVPAVRIFLFTPASTPDGSCGRQDLSSYRSEIRSAIQALP